MNFKKVLISSILAIALVFSSIAFASDASDVVIKLTIGNPEMTVNGVAAEIDPGRNTAPVILESRTLVPIRSIIEAMGGTVEWDAEQSKVTLKLKEDEINLIINSVSAFFNGVESTLDVAPVIINERTMLPIRYIAESFKFDVEWDGETSTVTITKKSIADETENVKDNENAADNDSNLSEEDALNEEYVNPDDMDFDDEFFDDEFFDDEFFEDEFFEDEFLDY